MSSLSFHGNTSHANTDQLMPCCITCMSCDILLMFSCMSVTFRWQVDSLHLLSSNLVDERSLSVPGLTPTQFHTEECIIRPQSRKVRPYAGTPCTELAGYVCLARKCAGLFILFTATMSCHTCLFGRLMKGL